MPRPKFARRKVLVDRKLQGGLSISIVILLACYFLLFCLIAIYSPYVLSVSSGSADARVQEAAREVGEMFDALIFPMGLTFICLALHIILLTHKVAGPAYRFKKTLESIRDRDLAFRVKLRKGDFLHDVAEDFNLAVARLREDIEAARTEAASLVLASRELEARSSGSAAEQAGDLVARAERVIACLGEYRLERDAPAAEEPEEAVDADEAPGEAEAEAEEKD